KFIQSIHGRRSRMTVFIWEGESIDFRCERTESKLIRFHFAGHTHGQQSPSVEGMFEYDHAFTLCMMTCDFHRIFYCLGAAICNHRFLGKGAGRDAVQFLRKLDIRFILRDAETGMSESLQLIRSRLNDLRVSVSDVHSSNAAGEVDHYVSVDVG